MNLIYICVFYQESYIQLLKLLITSIHKNSNKTDILIMTSPAFQPIIEKEISCFDLPIKYYIFNVRTLFEAGCARYNIFNYEDIYISFFFIKYSSPLSLEFILLKQTLFTSEGENTFSMCL